MRKRARSEITKDKGRGKHGYGVWYLAPILFHSALRDSISKQVGFFFRSYGIPVKKKYFVLIVGFWQV